jgi:predicted MPP superfamily phosphohydrolase
MKVLLTADLHFRLHWLKWLIEEGAGYDLVCVAGDLLDMFKSESRLEQASEVKKLLQELADIVPIAICSGNHDNGGRQISPDRAPVYEWFVQLASNPKIVTDGSTQVVGDLIVTTVPYHCSKEQKSIWLDRGFSIRRQKGMKWLVLHHVPPKFGSNVNGEEREATELLVAYRPEYFVSGHEHQFPYYSGKSWRQRFEDTTLLIPGQLLNAAYLNYIVLDTHSGDAEWHTSSQTWISENELFDHLVLKFPK